MTIASLVEHSAGTAVAGTGGVLVIGAGDRAHHDDGVGPVVVGELCRAGVLSAAPAGTEELRRRWRQAEVVIVVAAARSDPAHPGRTHVLAHDLPVREADRAATLVRELSGTPRRVLVYVVEGSNFTPGTGLSRTVAAAVDTLVLQIGQAIRGSAVTGTATG